ncbi:hypothetical protein N657DRAFT_682674 [Parathielavia appendiculata]|uniref:Uncharacterized protein n=1 Tax=Parathielavia appendiculata TaxID=2587402 RepID=A0AAN6Z1N5_9PEZI|nr:hypothetical protein N657DRAFT_682674 [Parathielavia appendiculata]
MVAAYKIYTGADLFGYPLTNVKRGGIAATILLPFIGKLVMGKLAALRKAEEVIRKVGHLNMSLADEAAKALDVVKSGGAGAAVNFAVDPRVADALAALVARSQLHASLDVFGLERVL